MKPNWMKFVLDIHVDTEQNLLSDTADAVIKIASVENLCRGDKSVFQFR